jgi:tRNA threonylcarbamoyladenosine biosynthesis protein TsaB
MSWILQIDTALETAMVSLAFKGKLVAERTNLLQKDHASFLHPAIALLVKEAGITLPQISAVAVVEGPGSYTGLRVGMASAKGLCYALNKPLITISTLKVLAASAKFQINDLNDDELICPMIDARRMEVFTAVYDINLEIVLQPCAMELNEYSFVKLMLNKKIYFLGNGSTKFASICPQKNAEFIKININSLIMSELAWQKCSSNLFSSVAYAEPAYLKDFFSTQKK